MTLWLELARVAAAVNVVVLAALAWVWVRGYREHGATHTLGLLVFAGFLLLENLLWVALYVFHDGFVGWYAATSVGVQAAMAGLCGLELIALSFLAYITWQ